MVGLESGVVDISAASSQFYLLVCALTNRGDVTCWGNDAARVLAPSRAIYKTPQAVTGLGGPATAISTGYDGACAIVAGALKCWGTNRYGTVGDGTTTPRPTPVVTLGSGVTAVAVAERSVCAVQSGGLKCWGDNRYGQLGIGSTTAARTPVTVPGLDNGVADVTAGPRHACVRMTTGGASCWGDNAFGQLGDGTTTRRLTPVAVTGLATGVSDLSAGGQHTCGVVAGAAKCWGKGRYGRLGYGGLASRTTPTAVAGLGAGMRQISAGSTHTCAVSEAHQAKCWGYNQGALGNRAWGNASRPVFVAATSPAIDLMSAVKGSHLGGYELDITGAGFTDVTAVTFAGTPAADVRIHTSTSMTVTVPRRDPGPSRVQIFTTLGHSVDSPDDAFYFSAPSPGNDFVQIDALGFATCGVKSTGELKCWGLDFSAADPWTEVPTPTTVPGYSTGVRQVAVGGGFACLVTQAGAARCWGDNARGQLGDGTTTDRTSPTQVIGLESGVRAVAVGGEESCAILQTGGLTCWGDNRKGQVGDGTQGNTRPTPTPVSGMSSGVTHVVVAYAKVCAARSGAAYCWGQGLTGGLGDGDLTDHIADEPTPVVGMGSGVSGLTQSCALRNGGVFCWGENDYGQLGSDAYPTATPIAVPGMGASVTSVAGSWGSNCAVKSGRLSCWGENEEGQLGIGSNDNTSTPTAVAVLGVGAHGVALGGSTTFAIGADGADYGWGDNRFSSLGDGTTESSFVPTPVEP